MISPSLHVLFIGRMCGGLSTTLLYSVFETWMITEYHQRELEEWGLNLSTVFGTMTTISSMVAIVSGVFGDALLTVTGSRVSPFLASVVCLGAAFALISRYWVGWARISVGMATDMCLRARTMAISAKASSELQTHQCQA